jgi:hypothetical protein
LSNFAKYFTVLGATLLFGCAANPESADKGAQPQESDYAQWQVVDGYESSLQALAAWADYGSASRVALAIAYERNRLEGTTPAVCQALTQSREFRKLASMGRSREDFQVLADVQERSGAMTQERAACDRAEAQAKRPLTAGRF